MANETVTHGGVPCEKRNLITESFWQRGCDDAKAGRPETPPTNEGPYSRRNQGYAAGYDYGKTHYRMAEVGKRIIARELTPAITLAADAVQLARKFHALYERLAPSYGYATREDTRQFDPTTTNGKLMVAVCSELLGTGSAQSLASDATPQEELKTLCDWVIASVNDTADECNVEVWLLANELRKAARRLKEILE